MENLVEFVNLYKSYDKEDEDPIQNQYNNAFFLREVQKALIEEKEKSKKKINNVFNCFKEFIDNKVNYKKIGGCTNLDKEDKQLSHQEENIKEILNYLNRFINSKSYYEKFESYKNIRYIMSDLDNIEENMDCLQKEIDKLIYDIELENNEHILNYNYIEEKLDEIVREIAKERM